MKNCRIRHTYGEEEKEADISEEEALVITQNAVHEGIPVGCRMAQETSVSHVPVASENSDIMLGGKKMYVVWKFYPQQEKPQGLSP